MRVADVALPSRVDATTSSDVRYALQVARDATLDQMVLVDASSVEVIDVAGLGVLVGAHRRCLQEGKRSGVLRSQAEHRAAVRADPAASGAAAEPGHRCARC